MLKIKKIISVLSCLAMVLISPGLPAEAKNAEDLRNADIAELAAQPKFDAREYDIVTPVRDQGDTSLCWAYSTASASETSILRSGIDKSVNARTAFLSPLQIGYARHNRGADPLGNTNGEKNDKAVDWRRETGAARIAATMLSSWCGPVKTNVAYNANGWENAAYKLESAIAVDGSRLNTDASAREKMKRAIVKYGAVTFSYNNVRNAYYYNPNGETGSISSPHACTIIGWDDNIPASKFAPGKTNTDGGWLVKNSYSSLPYFYLSYEVTSEAIYAFEYVMNDKYDYNYFYDSSVEKDGIGVLWNVKQAANVFEAKGGDENTSEWIKAVNVGIIGKNTECTVKIYTDVPDKDFDPQNAIPAAEKKMQFDYAGFNCVELDEPVEVKKGSRFAAVASVTNKTNDASISIGENVSPNSFICKSYWTAMQAAVRIKVFTKTGEKNKAAVEFTGTGAVKVSGTGAKQLILAKYENERFQDLRIIPIDIDTGEKTIPLPSEWKKTERTGYKAFLWNSLSDIVPECPAAAE